MTKLSKKKPYEGHEIVYRKMKEKGILVWGQKGSGSTGKSCHPETNSFLKDVLSQPWAPKGGRAIELGCGTGPILRRICKRGFSGVGIDVSKTAIAMAKEQSKGLDVKFRQGDVCNLNTKSLGKFDLVIDGLCLHCIIDNRDRNTYLENVFKILKNGGLFVLLTMCGPVDRKKFHEVCPDFKLYKNLIYTPLEKKVVYEGTRKFDGCDYMANRFVGHWKNILREVRKAGFELKLIRYHANNFKDAFGTLTVGALK